MQLLLKLLQFGQWFEMPETLPAVRLDPHTIETQRLRLRPVLGAPLLEALAVQVAAARVEAEAVLMAALLADEEVGLEPWELLATFLAEPWATLWAAVAPLLAYATVARFLPFAQTTITSHSYVTKSTDQSTPVSSTTINTQVNTYLDTARGYEAELWPVLAALQPQLAEYLPAPTGCPTGPPPTTGTITTLLIRRR